MNDLLVELAAIVLGIAMFFLAVAFLVTGSVLIWILIISMIALI